MPRLILLIFMKGVDKLRRVMTFILAVLMCQALAGPALATDAQPEAYACSEVGEIQPRIEETMWYVRTVDGVKQMRLWSITYGKWLTDWITVT